MIDYHINLNKDVVKFCDYCAEHGIPRTFVWQGHFLYTINISEEQATAIRLIFDCVLEKAK